MTWSYNHPGNVKVLAKFPARHIQFELPQYWFNAIPDPLVCSGVHKPINEGDHPSPQLPLHIKANGHGLGQSTEEIWLASLWHSNRGTHEKNTLSILITPLALPTADYAAIDSMNNIFLGCSHPTCQGMFISTLAGTTQCPQSLLWSPQQSEHGSFLVAMDACFRETLQEQGKVPEYI
eukprot:1136944-Pelagomonas_calceolata.AAC.2